tara:strand:- start:25 stop:633 length:609 start_codon:yes stop_codon:yes gene_type:complete
MQIINSTERYTNLTTNRLSAASTDVDKLVANIAKMDKLTVNTAEMTELTVGDVLTSNNVFVSNGPCLALGGLTTSTVRIEENYNILPSYSGKHNVIANNTGAAMEIRLTPTADMSMEDDVTYHFTIGKGGINDLVTIVTDGVDTIVGTSRDGAGTAVYFNNTNVITIQPGSAVPGDVIYFRVDPTDHVYFIVGLSKNPGAIV